MNAWWYVKHLSPKMTTKCINTRETISVFFRYKIKLNELFQEWQNTQCKITCRIIVWASKKTLNCNENVFMFGHEFPVPVFNCYNLLFITMTIFVLCSYSICIGSNKALLTPRIQLWDLSITASTARHRKWRSLNHVIAFHLLYFRSKNLLCLMHSPFRTWWIQLYSGECSIHSHNVTMAIVTS